MNAGSFGEISDEFPMRVRVNSGLSEVFEMKVGCTKDLCGYHLVLQLCWMLSLNGQEFVMRVTVC